MEKERYWGITLTDSKGNYLEVRVVAPDRKEAQKIILEGIARLGEAVTTPDPRRERMGFFYELAKNQCPPDFPWKGRG